MIGADQVGQDLAEHDPRVGRPERTRGLDELALAQRQHEPADDPRHVGPVGRARSRKITTDDAGLDRPADAAPDGAGGADAEAEQQDRNRQHDVDQAREQRVDPAAVEAGEQADDARRSTVAMAVPMIPTSSATRVP